MSFSPVDVSIFGILIVFLMFVNKLTYGADMHNVVKRMDLESCIGELFYDLLQVFMKLIGT